MATTQPPYHDTIFGAPNQDPSSTTPTGTYLNSNTTEAGTGTGNTNHNLSSDHHAETSTGPHRSSLLNKLDPRVDTHSTHQQTSTVPSQQTHGNMVGSSTGASGGAPGVSDSSRYDPSMTGYNPSTGSGYNTAQSGEGASKSATTAQDAGSSMGKKGDEVGQGAKNIYSGIHVSFLSWVLHGSGCV